MEVDSLLKEIKRFNNNIKKYRENTYSLDKLHENLIDIMSRIRNISDKLFEIIKIKDTMYDLNKIISQLKIYYSEIKKMINSKDYLPTFERDFNKKLDVIELKLNELSIILNPDWNSKHNKEEIKTGMKKNILSFIFG